ncbi:hypothetical protein M2266_006022 [Streptomyces sp. SPB162]|nr:hypothetical protein [Streptomyces sp. SPB162]
MSFIRMLDCYPRTRGWTHPGRRRPPRAVLLPTRAGMGPRSGLRPVFRTVAPRRPRGEGPFNTASPSGVLQRSPPRGDGPSCMKSSAQTPFCARPCTPAPCTRGWTPQMAPAGISGWLLPARAGMDPGPPVPAHPRLPAPRTHGDGPESWLPATSRLYCFPHVRGWTRGQRGLVDADHLLHACPGMDPSVTRPKGASVLLPAPAGMDPVTAVQPEWGRCSPHLRGWTQVAGARAQSTDPLPARAGMVPPGLQGRRQWRFGPGLTEVAPGLAEVEVPGEGAVRSLRSCPLVWWAGFSGDRIEGWRGTWTPPMRSRVVVGVRTPLLG